MAVLAPDFFWAAVGQHEQGQSFCIVHPLSAAILLDANYAGPRDSLMRSPLGAQWANAS